MHDKGFARMSDTSESIRIKMLADAGFHPIALQESYLKLVAFVQRMTDIGDLCCTKCVEEMAEKLLKEIGEENE